MMSQRLGKENAEGRRKKALRLRWLNREEGRRQKEEGRRLKAYFGQKAESIIL
ncbi:MAG: hypothetical protein U7126_15260 [Microcoleus sp.]